MNSDSMMQATIRDRRTGRGAITLPGSDWVDCVKRELGGEMVCRRFYHASLSRHFTGDNLSGAI
jgi:hypothetical protein